MGFPPPGIGGTRTYCILEKLGFKQTCFDPDVWIRGHQVGYDYIGTHTDDVLVVAVDTTSIFENLKETYTIKLFGLPVVHLGCKFAQVKKGCVNLWIMGSTTYITECLRKLSEAQHRLYQQLVGMAEWSVQIWIFYICYALTSLDRFSTAPREVHLTRLVKIFVYIQNVPRKCISIVVSPEDIG